MKNFLCTLVLSSAFEANAVCLNPFGCGPSNNDECITEAAKMPTALGVNLARQQCDDKFVLPEKIRHAKQTQDAADDLASNWASFATNAALQHASDDVPTANSALKVMGKPSSLTGPDACTPIASLAQTTNQKCYTYAWIDARSARSCSPQVPVNAYGSAASLAAFLDAQSLRGPSCYFTLETIADNRRTVWGWWNESIPR